MEPIGGKSEFSNIYGLLEPHSVQISLYSNNAKVEDIFIAKESFEHNLEINCKTSEPQWFKVSHEIDEKSGEVFCTFEPKRVYPLNANFPDSMIITAVLRSKKIPF